jgi:hypothetical protein
MRNPEYEFQPIDAPTHTQKPKALDANPKAFAARVRAEMHRLVKALARKDYEAALLCLVPSELKAQELEAQLAFFWEEYASIDITPASRRPQHTQIQAGDKHQYTVRQTLVDPEGHGDCFIECTIDASLPVPDEAALVVFQRFGK